MMLEEKEQKLHKDVGGNENSVTTETNEESEKIAEIEEKTVAKETTPPTVKEDVLVEIKETNKESDHITEKEEKTVAKETAPPAVKEDALVEIEETNAEDAEDADNHRRHHIPLLDYHAMSLENLVGELQRLVRNEKIQAIKNHVEGIKSEFDLKFQEFLEEKKEEFVTHGGNVVDFKYNSVAKRQFNEVYAEYREKRNQYYKNLEQSLKTSLEKRLEIIEELKALINVEEDINTTYKNFKDLQERWRHAGSVPRNNYNDVWRTYHHHVEIFYDFLHLNRELRDLDFKYNLEEKEKLVKQAEALINEPDLNKAFRELQTLHKIWKEDIGPVGKDNREEIWDRFSNATKAMHHRRQEHFKELEKSFEGNLVQKNKIIEAITVLAGNVEHNHKGLQKQIKELEALRSDFFKAGKVPQKQNEATWARFKEAVRTFNRSKNTFYKNLKKEQQENLEKKRELLKLAVSLKDSEEWDTTTPEMKRIQQEWKNIGHVPRKFSDAIWNDFKSACNHYFERLHALKNKGSESEVENLAKKNACLDTLKAFTVSEDRENDLKAIKALIEDWKGIGRVPFNKKGINGKFNKVLDGLFKKLGVSQQESELMKYGNKIQQLAKADSENALYKERTFIRRKIEDSKNEIRQLENNLQFFSNASEDNPLVKDVIKKIDRQKDTLATWNAKLKKINILQHNLAKEEEEEAEVESNKSTDDTPKDA